MDLVTDHQYYLKKTGIVWSSPLLVIFDITAKKSYTKSYNKLLCLASL